MLVMAMLEFRLIEPGTEWEVPEVADYGTYSKLYNLPPMYLL